MRDGQTDRETVTQTEIDRQRRRPTDESKRDRQTVSGRGSLTDRKKRIERQTKR